jgi:hypothetical protein
MDKRHRFTTAYFPAIHAFVALLEFRESDNTFLCNVGYANVRIAESELTRFTI